MTVRIIVIPKTSRYSPDDPRYRHDLEELRDDLSRSFPELRDVVQSETKGAIEVAESLGLAFTSATFLKFARATLESWVQRDRHRELTVKVVQPPGLGEVTVTAKGYSGQDVLGILEGLIKEHDAPEELEGRRGDD